MQERICEIELVFFTWQFFSLEGVCAFFVAGPAVETREEECKERGIAEEYRVEREAATCLLLGSIVVGWLKKCVPEEVGETIA